MLTLLYHELLSHVMHFPGGLYALTIAGEERTVLLVKMLKEALLVARLNKGFKIYIVPIEEEEKSTVGLVSAFFDDPDEPLVILTPMFDNQESTALRNAILGGDLDVYLFDDNNRELLSYSAVARVPPATKERLEKACLLSFNLADARAALDTMSIWFGQRNKADDDTAIAIDFGNALFSEDVLIVDIMPENHTFHGNRGFSYTTLIRQEPGKYQEHDIVRLLQRIFRPEQIYLAPLRIGDREEIADIIVITDVRIILIQAKDSPNTAQVLSNRIDRKRATAMKSMTNAIKQIKGAVRYSRSHSPLKMRVNGDEVVISIDHLELTSLIILKEMFNNQYDEYSPPLLQLFNKTQVPCIALDYSELHMYTSRLADEKSFFEAYNRVFKVALEHGEFPRLRII